MTIEEPTHRSSHAAIGSKQTAEALAAFNLCLLNRRVGHWRDQLIAQTLMRSIKMIVGQILANRIPRRAFAKQDWLVAALGLQAQRE